MGWLSDTWREITTGGKAKTATYNKSSSSSPRAPASPSGRSSRGGAVPAPRVSTPAPAATTTPSGAGASNARPAAGLQRQTWAAPKLQQQTIKPVARPTAPTTKHDLLPPEKEERKRPGLMEQIGLGLAAAPPAGGATVLNLSPTGQTPTTQLDPGPPKTPAEKLAERRAEAVEAERNQERAWTQVAARELTDDEYLALTPRQRAAVQFNTGLVAASAADKAAGGDANTRSYLTGLELLEDDTDVDAFLKLDRAIGDSILNKLDDTATRQSSAESLRWAQGIPGAAPNAKRYSEAMDSAVMSADAMALKLSNGVGSLLPGAQTQGAGFGESARDSVLRRAYEIMVDSAVEHSPQTIADGLATLNANNGTDVAPQELWDFLGRQLDAADFAALSSRTAPTVPVEDATITPLSVADIRARYGI